MDLWRGTSHRHAWAAVRDDLEALVTAPLHDVLLGARTAEREQDDAIASRTEALAHFLQPCHMGLNVIVTPSAGTEADGADDADGAAFRKIPAPSEVGSSSSSSSSSSSFASPGWQSYVDGEWSDAVDAMHTMGSRRSPRDKLDELQKACHCLCRLISRGNTEKNNRKKRKKLYEAAGISASGPADVDEERGRSLDGDSEAGRSGATKCSTGTASYSDADENEDKKSVRVDAVEAENGSSGSSGTGATPCHEESKGEGEGEGEGEG